MHGVHPADSERVDPRLPKSIKKKTLYKISRFSQKIGFGNRTNDILKKEIKKIIEIDLKNFKKSGLD